MRLVVGGTAPSPNAIEKKQKPTLVQASHSPLWWGLCVDRSSQDWLWESAQVGELKFVTYVPVELAGYLIYLEKTCISLGADGSHHGIPRLWGAGSEEGT